MNGIATVMDRVIRGEGEVPERVDRMIAFLLANASAIAQADRVEISFHCAGKKVRSEIVESTCRSEDL